MNTPLRTLALALLAVAGAVGTAQACAMWRPVQLEEPDPLVAAAEAEAKGALHRAARLYDRAMNRATAAADQLEAAVQAGRLHALIGEQDRAVARWTRAIELAPERNEARLALGRYLLGSDDAGAARQLRDAFDHAESDAVAGEIAAQLAAALARLGDHRGAAEALVAAYDLGASPASVAHVEPLIDRVRAGGLALQI